MVSKLGAKLFNLPVALRTRLYPSLTRLWFKLQGIEYGEDLQVYNRVYVINRGSIRIGSHFMMTSGDAINPISSNLKGCFYTELGGVISIGDYVGMSATRMWIAQGLTIGNHVSIGAFCLLIDTDSHQLDYLARRGGMPSCPDNDSAKVQSAPITIEDDVWIGAHCIILKGVTIGARSVIGAGSVVTKSIPADCVAAGNPAKVIRQLK